MIVLPFPPASLSGQASGSWQKKAPIVKSHRLAARVATKKARYNLPADGDIQVHVTFYPPDRRGDRCNFPNRMKPYFDGIADGLGVNDRRFVPNFHFCEPVKPGRVEVSLSA